MSDISKIQINGTLYDINDLIARRNLNSHEKDFSIHISAEERALWNTSRIIVKTTSEWESEITYIPEEGYLCIYSDYVTEGALKIPAIKVGDGTTYIVDLPFLIGTEAQFNLNKHIHDTSKHITEEERLAWDNKISCSIDEEDSEQIVFYTN